MIKLNFYRFAKTLRKYMDFDVYGKCGNFSCPRTNRNCFQEKGKDYFFYFAFENSLCKDYITEKTFDRLR